MLHKAVVLRSFNCCHFLTYSPGNAANRHSIIQAKPSDGDVELGRQRGVSEDTLTRKKQIIYSR